MKQKKSKRASQPDRKEVRNLDDEIVELSVLLPRQQAVPLEREARRRGLTAGQMIRSLIRNFFLCQATLHRN
jgi:hypothetical protein